MAVVSLQCGDCGTLLKSVEEAQEHAELTKHTNFRESTEVVLLNLVCSSCGKPCRSKTETDLHGKRTGHTEFVDKTADATKPNTLEAAPMNSVHDVMNMVGALDGDQLQPGESTVVPEVDAKLLEKLEAMGFPKVRATRALHYSGINVTAEATVNWIIEHEDDAHIDQMSLVSAKAAKPSLTPEQMKIKAQELNERARKKKEEEDKRMEREREKERIRIGKELLEPKRIDEENERKRIMALHKVEKEDERRARDRIRQKLEEDKAERRQQLGLLPEDHHVTVKPAQLVMEETKSSLPIRPATKAEQMRECLRSLKQSNRDDDDGKVKTTFTTLLTIVKHVATKPDEEKFRKIRLSNPVIHERVEKLGGIKFLELCGFEVRIY